MSVLKHDCEVVIRGQKKKILEMEKLFAGTNTITGKFEPLCLTNLKKTPEKYSKSQMVEWLYYEWGISEFPRNILVSKQEYETCLDLIYNFNLDVNTVIKEKITIFGNVLSCSFLKDGNLIPFVDYMITLNSLYTTDSPKINIININKIICRGGYLLAKRDWSENAS